MAIQAQAQAQEQIVTVAEVIDAIFRGDFNERFDIDKNGVVNIHDAIVLIDQILTPEMPDNNEITVNGVTFKMIPVEGGTFIMGASITAAGAYTFEKPEHQVTLSSYKIGETPVTQELWNAVMGGNPSHFVGNNRPVENVSWEDTQTFIAKLNSMTGMSFRLPTEAEWEFAARGGNNSKGYMYAGSNTAPEVAWLTTNSENKTHDVATKLPNELGIYDMSGNVSELCSDWYSRYISASQTNPTGSATGSAKVYRGGSFEDGARLCRITYRYSTLPDKKSRSIGFRLALSF